MNCSRAGVVLLVVLLLSPIANAEDWSRFRGPNGSGVNVTDALTPVKWSPDQNLKWKVALPGAGVSSPIVVGDKIFVTCYSGYGLDAQNPGEIENLKRHLVCVHADTGDVVWDKTIDAVQPEDPYSGAGVPAHGYASHTPVSDGERIYVFFGKTGALAFDLDGNQLWQTGLGTESDPMKWGSSSSPILFEDIVIVTASAESQSLVGLDKKTGKEVWRQEASKLDSTWATPLLVDNEAGETDLVVSVPGEVWGLNPATGKMRWFVQADQSEQANASVIAAGNTVYNISGRGGGAIAIRTGGKGDVTDSHVVWKGRDTSRFGSPVTYQGKIYNVGSGIVACIDCETGETVSQVRLESDGRAPRGGAGRFGSLDYASPVIANGKIYIVKGNGETFVLQHGDELLQVAVNRFTDETESFGGTPAFSQGKMIVRSNKHLYCAVAGDFDESAEPAPKVDESSEGGARGGGGRGNRGGNRGGGRAFDPNAFFDEQDQDDDGKLVGDEIQEPLKGRMEDLDKDSDGEITKQEFIDNYRAAFSRGSGRGGREDNRPKRPERPTMDDGQ